MQLSALIVTMLTSFLIPAAVKLLGNGRSTWIKQFASALLAAATGVITTATTLDGTAVISSAAVVLALGAFISAQAAYVTLYKPHTAKAS